MYIRFGCIKVVHSIDKGRENTKDAGNTGIARSSGGYVCRSVGYNGRSEKDFPCRL